MTKEPGSAPQEDAPDDLPQGRPAQLDRTPSTPMWLLAAFLALGFGVSMWNVQQALVHAKAAATGTGGPGRETVQP